MNCKNQKRKIGTGPRMSVTYIFGTSAIYFSISELGASGVTRLCSGQEDI